QRCVLDVFEKDLAHIQKGQTVTIRTSAFPDDDFKGEIGYISPRVNENSRTIKIGVNVADANNRLKFGMFVTGHVRINSERVLALPETAVQNISNRATVLVVDDENRISPRAVKVGRRSRRLVEILNGLSEGERVVSRGGFILTN